MRSERLVSLLLLLQSRSPRSARELSQALDVSMRTIYRDVDALSLSGVPVYAERGSTGGIALSDGYRKAIAQFSTDELHALFVSVSDPLADLGVTGHDLALHKLKGALPDRQRHTADKARERILVDHRKWYRTEQPAEVLAVLRRALWEDRIVRIAYRDRVGASTEREIEPLGLVAKAGVWYVIARSHGELRTFRAERIAAAKETGETFARPDGFDLEAYWETTMTTMERTPETPFEATVTIDGDAIGMLASYFTTEILSEGDGTVCVRVRFPSQSVAESQLMMLSKSVKQIGPAHLREAVAVRARELASLLEVDPDAAMHKEDLLQIG